MSSLWANSWITTLTPAGCASSSNQDDQHRAALPGLAEHLVVVFVQHAGLVDRATRDEEVARIDDHPHPAGVGLQADAEHRQAGLQRDRQQHVVVQCQALRAVELLAGEEVERQLAQARAICRGEVVEEGQGGARPAAMCAGATAGRAGAMPQEPADESAGAWGGAGGWRRKVERGAGWAQWYSMAGRVRRAGAQARR